jgi:hypothetical protein
MKITEEERKRWLDDWRNSGKTACAYAKENGLNPQSFYYWTKIRTKNNSCFVEVPVKAIQPVQFNQEILIEKGDVKIHIPLSAGCRELQTIFNALTGAV